VIVSLYGGNDGINTLIHTPTTHITMTGLNSPTRRVMSYTSISTWVSTPRCGVWLNCGASGSWRSCAA